MGQFSWIFSDTNMQLIDNEQADAFLLVPEPFHEKYGKSIYESCYDGYGHFGQYDVYELVAEWNKWCIPEIIRKCNNGTWECEIVEDDIADLKNYHEGKTISCELRWIGIIMSCYDRDNFALKYPIKIVSKDTDYRSAKPSRRDPNQGWRM